MRGPVRGTVGQLSAAENKDARKQGRGCGQRGGEAGFYCAHMCMRRVWRRTVTSVCFGCNIELAGTSLEVRGLLQQPVGKVVMSLLPGDRDREDEGPKTVGTDPLGNYL